jgi:hypothetical protein
VILGVFASSHVNSDVLGTMRCMNQQVESDDGELVMRVGFGTLGRAGDAGPGAPRPGLRPLFRFRFSCALCLAAACLWAPLPFGGV